MNNHGFHQRRTAGLMPASGGTVMGGPSGDDDDGSFVSPYSADVKTDTTVKEFSKDDHSINIKDKTVYPRPPPMSYGPALGPGAGPFGRVMAPGAGPFPKRSYPSGGTAMGGPSGDDEGQVFDMSMTADIHTNVNEYSKDDHSIDIKHTDVFPPPPEEFAPPFGGPYKRDWEPIEGGTAMGGPSGDDGGQTFSAPILVETNTNVDEHWEDNHSITLKHKDEYPAPPPAAFPLGGGPGPVIPEGGSLWRRAYSPDRTPGGTAMGGPSGYDGGQNVEMPTSVGVDTTVDEHHEDNHAIKIDDTDVHLPAHADHAIPHMPWMPYGEQQAAAGVPPSPAYEAPEPSMPESAPAPPQGHQAPPAFGAPHGEQTASDDTPECTSSVHEVVRTVTMTQYHHPEPTETGWMQPTSPDAYQTTEVPMAPTPWESGADADMPPSATTECSSMTTPEFTHSTAIMDYPSPTAVYPSPSDDYPGPSSGWPAPSSDYPMPSSEWPAPSSEYPVPSSVSPTSSSEYPMPSSEWPTPSPDYPSPSSDCTTSTSEYPGPSPVWPTTTSEYPTLSSVWPTTASSEYPSPSSDCTTSTSEYPGPSPVWPTTTSEYPSTSSECTTSTSEYPGPSSVWPTTTSEYPSTSSECTTSTSEYPSPMSSGPAYSTIPISVPMGTPTWSSYMTSVATPSWTTDTMMPTGVSPESSDCASSSMTATMAESPYPSSTMFMGAASRMSNGMVSAAAAFVGVLAFIL